MAGRPRRSPGKLNLNGDMDTIAELKCVLAYESVVRGRPLGRTCFEMVMEAADVGSYPEDLRERLAELQEEADRLAAESVLDAERRERS